MLLKLSTAVTVTALLISSTDHISGATGKAGTPVKGSKAGGAAFTFTNTLVEIDAVNLPGLYSLAVAVADLSALGRLDAFANAAGCDPWNDTYQVVAFDPADAVHLGLSALPASAANAPGGLPVSIAGALDLDELNTDLEAIQTALGTPTNASLAADIAANFARLGAPIGPSISADIEAILTTALTESYAPSGSPMTTAQALYMIWSYLNNFVIIGTAMTSRKLDSATTSMVHTLNDATNPTGVVRTS